MALAGLALFYGVEALPAARATRREEGGEDRTGGGAVWLSIGSFAVYNALIGCLLLRSELDAASELGLNTLPSGCTSSSTTSSC